MIQHFYQRKRLAGWLLGLAIIITAIAFWLWQHTYQTMALTTPSLNGGLIVIPDPQQRPTWLNVWSISCGICIEELPELEDFYQQQGVKINFVTITMPYDAPNLVNDLKLQKNINFPIGLDLDGKISQQLAVKVTPSHYLIDAQGRILYTTYGKMRQEDISNAINSAL